MSDKGLKAAGQRTFLLKDIFTWQVIQEILCPAEYRAGVFADRRNLALSLLIDLANLADDVGHNFPCIVQILY
jgi:hypothetical protein